jgi:hypothetical protein
MTKGGEVATLKILESTQEIGIGDRLVPDHPPAGDGLCAAAAGCADRRPHRFDLRPPDRNRHAEHRRPEPRRPPWPVQVGYVLALLDTGETILDRTSDRREYIKLPDERIGAMFVFRVFDEISYALVLRVTQPVKVGDRFVGAD